MKLHFVGIDWQNDFCMDNGALFVPGATEDAERCADLIHRLIDKIDDIHLTMDSHRLFDISHPIFWRNSSGENPAPFTIIGKKDIDDGVWFPAVPSLRKKAFNYISELEANQRYPLCIWPPHCLIGQWGHNIVDPVVEACTAWETKHLGLVDIITKGSNPFTEHYSAVQADVPDPDDPDTALNIGEGSLINILENVDLIALTGQALSHCLANTVRDIANNFGEENIKKMVLIRDCTSSVPGFEQLGEDFIKEMTGRGMQISSASKFLR